jgi:hypothetical protein
MVKQVKGACEVLRIKDKKDLGKFFRVLYNIYEVKKKEVRMDQVSKVSVRKEVIGTWDAVSVQEIPSWVKEVTESGIPVLRYGGPNFGAWSGLLYSRIFLFYLKGEVDFQKLITIKRMQKTWEDKGTGKKGQSEYFVLSQSDKTEIEWYLYELRSWHKTTIRGFGRDRNYKEHLEPVGLEDNGDVSIECVELVRVSCGCRSGRYGNEYRLVLTRVPCQVVGEGVS